MFGQALPTTEQVAQGFGWPAAIVIIGMAVVIVFLVRRDDKKQTKIDELYELRINEAKETLDKVTTPLERVAESTKTILELLYKGKSGPQ